MLSIYIRLIKKVLITKKSTNTNVNIIKLLQIDINISITITILKMLQCKQIHN